MRGKVVRQSRTCGNGQDHPRLCGEKLHKTSIENLFKGSPPPMRGKGKNCRSGFPHTGITPAYAGKSLTHPHIRHSKRDHPRLCGEKDSEKFCCFRHRGSPPPMRGKAEIDKFYSLISGITPAYAGKSSGASRR